jgi:hypothetical protein
MRIARIEDLHADGGWRTTSFLKLTTDEGLIGWAEYYEGFGASGVTDLIRRFAEIVTGMDPRDVGRISTSLHAISRLAAGGMNHQAIAAIENACLDVKAKALGVPVYALFGGAMRDRLDLYLDPRIKSVRFGRGGIQLAFEFTAWVHAFAGMTPTVGSRSGELDDISTVGRRVWCAQRRCPTTTSH